MESSNDSCNGKSDNDDIIDNNIGKKVQAFIKETLEKKKKKEKPKIKTAQTASSDTDVIVSGDYSAKEKQYKFTISENQDEGYTQISFDRKYGSLKDMIKDGTIKDFIKDVIDEVGDER